MTTTLCANAQELQVSTTVEENARDAPAWSSRAGSPSTIATVLEKLQSALQKSRYRSHHHSAHRGGLELSNGTGLYGACRSTQCCLAVWSRWVESGTRLVGGFRALKKTPEAPYTTKVNYREHTSRARGTTLTYGFTRTPVPVHARSAHFQFAFLHRTSPRLLNKYIDATQRCMRHPLPPPLPPTPVLPKRTAHRARPLPRVATATATSLFCLRPPYPLSLPPARTNTTRPAATAPTPYPTPSWGLLHARIWQGDGPMIGAT